MASHKFLSKLVTLIAGIAIGYSFGTDKGFQEKFPKPSTPKIVTITKECKPKIITKVITKTAKTNICEEQNKNLFGKTQEELDNSLIMAVRAENVPLIDKLLEMGADINVKNGSLLHIAGSNLELGLYLIKKGCNLNTKGGGSLFRFAGIEGTSSEDTSSEDTSVMQKLIDLGFDVNTDLIRNINWTIDQNSVTKLKFILDNGADLSVDTEGSLLREAIKHNNFEVTKLLINHEAPIPDPGALLQLAAQRGVLDIIELLISKGISLDNFPEKGLGNIYRMEIRNYLIENGVKLTSKRGAVCNKLRCVFVLPSEYKENYTYEDYLKEAKK